MKREIADFLYRCTMCDQTKGTTTPGPPHPLPIPSSLWQDVSVNLVTGLPQINSIDGVCTVVDQFMKEIVVFLVSCSISSEELVCEYQNKVWQIHGTPSSILSDCGLQISYET